MIANDLINKRCSGNRTKQHRTEQNRKTPLQTHIGYNAVQNVDNT